MFGDLDVGSWASVSPVANFAREAGIAELDAGNRGLIDMRDSLYSCTFVDVF